MNKLIAFLFTSSLLAASLAAADDTTSKDLKKIVDEGPYLETSQNGISLNGYVDAGYQYNFNGRGENMNTSSRFSNATATEGDSKSRGDFDLNAVKICLQKQLTSANELQAGFRVDIMMGEDVAILGQNASGSDSITVEQAYMQFRLPYGNGIDFKVGKMGSIFGYEIPDRPVNMNITYSNLFNDCQPSWQTGVISSYQINDLIGLQLGVTNGSMTDNGVGIQANDNASLLAVILLTPSSNFSWHNGIMYGINGGNFKATDDAPTIFYDTYFNWKPKFAQDKLLIGFNADLGNAPIATGLGNIAEHDTTWWGWAFYTKYKFNDIFSLANRFEYIHNDDSNAFGNGPAPSREDIWSETITARFDVIEDVMLRTEYRLDWGKDYMTTSGTKNTDGPLHTVAAEIVYSF